MGEALLAMLLSVAEVLSTTRAVRWFIGVAAILIFIALIMYFGVMPM